ncbi:MAG TPA: dATP/dGTP pyrophosphohydrolase domain-containing protein [Gemmata sp.]
MLAVAQLGCALEELAADQAEWSQLTFGLDIERGPVGALKHLEKEAREAAANPTDVSEYADCLLLILDAARRAGLSPLKLIQAAQAKMVVNKSRTWPQTVGDVPTEHVR